MSIAFGFIIPTKADSGWDTSYDSGGSWDSGSDYSSSDWGDSSSRGNNGSISFLQFIIILVLYFEFIKSLNSLQSKKLKNSKTIINQNLEHEISEEVFQTLIKDLSMEQMRAKIYYIYEQIQYAWSNFNYDELKKYTTDELYNMYVAQLHPLKIKSQQNIMKDIQREEIKIINVSIENNIVNVEAYVKVSCYDYVINTKNNHVIRGTDKRKLELEYIIDFVKDNNSKTKINCPNCGNEVDIISSQKCQYCDSILVQNASEFVMSKKTMIGQRTILK